jgi:hypothetical protein
MQVSEIDLYETDNGTGRTITANAGTGAFTVRGIDLEQVQTITYESSSPEGEHVQNLLDGNARTTFGGNSVLTKYLNFGGPNSGFIVTPQGGPSTLTSFRLTTAFDESQRDPVSYILYGTNDAIASEPHSQGNAENWLEIASGFLGLPFARDTPGDIVTVNNVTTYKSYRMVFPTLRSASDAMQLSGAQFFGEFSGSGADTDGDGDIDGADFLVLQRSASDLTAWKTGFGSGGASAVPEPGFAALVLAGVATVVFWHKSKGQG